MRNYKNLSKMTIWDLCEYNSNKNFQEAERPSNRVIITCVQLFVIAELIADKNKNRRNKGETKNEELQKSF